MNFREVRNIARYESRLISRGNLWRIFVFIAVGMTVYLLFPKLRMYWWEDVALDSSIPYIVSYYFNLLQVLIVVFVVFGFIQTQKKRNAMEVMDVYPAGNGERMVGFIWAVFRLVLGLNIVVLFIAAVFHVLFYQGTMSLWINLFYLLTLTLPTLVFVLGLSLFVMRVVKVHFLALILLLGYLLLGYFFLSKVLHGVLDPWGRSVPNVFSAHLGHVGLVEYLIHRGCYLLLGLGFICLSVWWMPRLPSAARPERGYLFGGMASCLAGVLLIAGFLGLFAKTESKRERYREAYLRYAKMPHANITEHDIDYYVLPDGYRAVSRLTLKNNTNQDLKELLLFLNPGLKVKRLELEGKEIPARRDEQVLVVHHPLLSGDSVRFLLEYEGKIDDKICYVDIPASDFYQANAKDREIYKLGRQMAYCSPKYTLLHPECLWYPVSVPVLNPDMPFIREVNFTRYNLGVHDVGDQTVISQGKATRENNRVIFSIPQPQVGLSLTIGDYVRRSMVIDSTEFEIYCFPESDYILKEFDSWEEVEGDEAKDVQLIRIKRWVEENRVHGKYPFERLAFVEAPVSFIVYPRWWKTGSSYTQPGMVFIPERAIRNGVGSLAYKKMYFMTKVIYIDNQKIEYRREPDIVEYFFGGMYDPLFALSLQGSEFVNYMSSPVYPGINFVIENIMRLHNRFAYDFSGDYHFEGAKYFDEKSVVEALEDPGIVENLSVFLTLKLTQLQGMLALYIDWDDLYRFMGDFNTRAMFRTCDFEELRVEYEKISGFDIGALFDQWYNSSGTPALVLRDIQYWLVGDKYNHANARLKVCFKVYNPSNVNGIIALMGDRSYADNKLNVRSFLVRPGECKEIKEIVPYASMHLITTGLSFNAPVDFCYNPALLLRQENSVTDDLSTGVITIDASAFAPGKGEYIVDNTDENFHLIDSVGQRKRLADFFKKDELFDFKGISGIEEGRWREVIDPRLHGGVVRNAYVKKAGKGLLKAEWSQVLPEEGEYEFFFYQAPVDDGVYAKEAELYYTVYFGDESKEVLVDMSEERVGWISLGKFYFPANTTAVVVLDDRGCTIPPQPTPGGWSFPEKKQVIVADAVKWVKK